MKNAFSLFISLIALATFWLYHCYAGERHEALSTMEEKEYEKSESARFQKYLGLYHYHSEDILEDFLDNLPRIVLVVLSVVELVLRTRPQILRQFNQKSTLIPLYLSSFFFLLFLTTFLFYVELELEA